MIIIFYYENIIVVRFIDPLPVSSR